MDVGRQSIIMNLNVIRTIEDGWTINRIMAINRFVVLAATFFLISLTWVLNIIRFDPFIAFYYVLPVAMIMNGVWLLYCRIRKPKRFYFLPQVLIDITLILVAVYFSGRLYSDFLFLPLIVLSLAAFVSWRLSFAAFAISLSFYLYLFFYQIIGLPFQEIFQSFGGLNGMKLIRIIVFAFMGILTIVAISYFISEIRRRNKEIENIKQETYAKTVRSLCDSLTAIRWTLENLDDKTFLLQNKEFVENIQNLLEFKKVIMEKVKDSLNTTNSDFTPIQKYGK